MEICYVRCDSRSVTSKQQVAVRDLDKSDV